MLYPTLYPVLSHVLTTFCRLASRQRPHTAGSTRPANSHSKRKSADALASASSQKIKKIPDDAHVLQVRHGRPDVAHFTPKDPVLQRYDEDRYSTLLCLLYPAYALESVPVVPCVLSV